MAHSNGREKEAGPNWLSLERPRAQNAIVKPKEITEILKRDLKDHWVKNFLIKKTPRELGVCGKKKEIQTRAIDKSVNIQIT